MFALCALSALFGLWFGLAIADHVRIKRNAKSLKTGKAFAVAVADESLPAFLRKQAF